MCKILFKLIKKKGLEFKHLANFTKRIRTKEHIILNTEGISCAAAFINFLHMKNPTKEQGLGTSMLDITKTVVGIGFMIAHDNACEVLDSFRIH